MASTIFRRLIVVILSPLIVWAVFALLWGAVLGFSEAVEGLSMRDTLQGRRAVLLLLFAVSLFAGWRFSRAMW
jgi:hypothetical protein